jgi:cytochrome P450
MPSHESMSLTDPQLHASGEQHDVWRELRSRCPVSWHERDGEDPFWSVTGYDLGAEVLGDWRRFSSSAGTLLRRRRSEPYPGAGRMLVQTDPPRHDRLRRAVMAPFTLRAIAALEGRAREVTRTLFARASAAGTCDFVTDVAAIVPLAVSADLLDIEPGRVQGIAEATATIASTISDIDGADAQAAHFTVLDYYAGVLEGDLPAADGGLLSSLKGAQRDGLDLTDEEILLTCDNVVVAASETTQNVLSNGLLALLADPARWRFFAAGKDAARIAAEELVRWGTPVTHNLRTATTDTVLGGMDIAAGDAVAVWLPAVNRDERAFSEPGQLRLDRRPNRHLAFGIGVHFCLGAALARMIVRVVFEELARSGAVIELDGEPRRLHSYHLNGLASLPVRVRAR